jgi:hypothetical protein
LARRRRAATTTEAIREYYVFLDWPGYTGLRLSYATFYAGLGLEFAGLGGYVFPLGTHSLELSVRLLAIFGVVFQLFALFGQYLVSRGAERRARTVLEPPTSQSPPRAGKRWQLTVGVSISLLSIFQVDLDLDGSAIRSGGPQGRLIEVTSEEWERLSQLENRLLVGVLLTTIGTSSLLKLVSLPITLGLVAIAYIGLALSLKAALSRISVLRAARSRNSPRPTPEKS